MYNHVFVAGTFDGIHKGHEAMLTRAFAEGENVTIGLTSDAFVKKYKNAAKTFEDRKRGLEGWLSGKKGVTIIPIDDPYEPAASEQNLDALVVSTETRKRGEEINEIRAKRGLKKLVLLEVPMIPAEDQKTISSTRIKTGEIDREGRLTMPDNLRPELQKPLGKIITEIPKHKFIITVGDVTTKRFLDAGRVPDVMIIDRKVGRKAFTEIEIPSNAVYVQSGPGYISHEAIQKILSPVLVVDGEEDLLALPAIAEAPLGSFVYYGQPARNASASVAGGPGVGLVEVEVTEEKKKHIASLLEKFLNF